MPEIERGTVRLHYDDRGDGPAVLFHTGGGGDARMWETAGYISACGPRRTLALDHRGHGRSDIVKEVEAHSLEEYVADVIAVLDAAGVTRVAIVGYSDGARVAMAVAARHPSRVAAVVAIGGLGTRDDDAEAARRRASAAALRTVGMHAAMESAASKEDETPPRWFIDNLAETETEMYALELEGWASAPTIWTDLGRATAPTLVVMGEAEDPRGRDARAARRARDNVEVHVLPRMGHLQAFWRSDLTLPAITEFMNRHLSVGAAQRIL